MVPLTAAERSRFVEWCDFRTIAAMDARAIGVAFKDSVGAERFEDRVLAYHVVATELVAEQAAAERNNPPPT